MSLKQEIETWVSALNFYDNNEFDEALNTFNGISDTSKILFNQGVIHATLGEHEKAVDCYQRAVRLDQYLAVAYFQQGVSNFLMGDFEEALANFNDTLLYLRGNNNIDYEQLGLKFKLYSCEVLFNRGLCYIYLQQKDAGMQDLVYAAKEKVVPDHDVIDEAINEQAEGYTVFSIPVGIVYRPNEAKVKNLKTKDYLGKARLVAATDRANAFTGFTGAEMKKATATPAKDDRPAEGLSFAASNLVKPGLQSRSRQQSEPPINRNVFPPTPPPEADKTPTRPGGGMTRAQSVKGGGPKPPALDLSVAGFEGMRGEKPRPAPQRSASERPRPTRDYTERRRRASDDEDETRTEYADSVYDMYNGRQSVSSRAPRRKQERPQYIEEEEEEDDFDVRSGDDGPEFEMMPPRLQPKKSVNRRDSSRSRAASRRPDIRKIRVKVHAEDTRYVMIGATVEFPDFVDQIRSKFGFRRNFKVKIKDEEDMITMADQDDLDLALSQARQAAQRERSEMGKMEVWVQEI